MTAFTLNDYRVWAKLYEKNLAVIRGDLELILNYDYRFFVALDFCDLLEFCLPYLNISSCFEMNQKGAKMALSEKEIARYGLFYLLEKLYQKPPLLLPPYFKESKDFIKNYKKEQSIQMQENMGKILDKYIEMIKISFDNFTVIDESNVDAYLAKLIEYSRDLAILLNPFLIKGIEGYSDLIRSFASLVPAGINDYFDLLYMAEKEDYSHIEYILNFIRPKYQIQNRMDAKAIKYIEEINKKILSRDILIFTSSASHMITFKDVINYEDEFQFNRERIPPIKCQKTIGDKKIKLLRDLDFFYVALTEVSNLINDENMDADDFENFKLEDLLQVVNRDLNFVRYFLFILDDTYSVNFSGRCGRDFYSGVVGTFFEFKELIIQRNEMNLILIIRNLMHLLKSYYDREENYKKNLVQFLNQIRLQVDKDILLNAMLDRNKILDDELKSFCSWTDDFSIQFDRYIAYKDFGMDELFMLQSYNWNI
jgi:hypothetical protein